MTPTEPPSVRRLREAMGGLSTRANPGQVDAAALRRAVRTKDMEGIERHGGIDRDRTSAHLSAMDGWFRGRGVGFLGYQASAAAVVHADDLDAARRHTERILEQYAGEYRRPYHTGLKTASHHAAVRALAEASQAMYDEDYVTLYRGIYGEQGRELRTQLQSMKALSLYQGVPSGRGEETIDVALAPVSSWTESRKRAQLFAEGYGTKSKVAWSPPGYKKPPQYAAVLRMRVPRRDIAFSWRLLRSGVAGTEVAAMALRDREVGVFSRGVARISLDDIDVPVGKRPAAW